MRKLIHRALRRLGYDMYRFDPAVFPQAQQAKLLQATGIDLVLDVGANAGQFASRLREVGYRGRIVSFEPLRAARQRLLDASSGDAQWVVADRAALGDRAHEVDVNVSEDSANSSILEMLAAQLPGAPGSRYVAKERVPMRRLDEIAAPYLAPDSVTLLKIDTQGFEDRVLDGAADILPRIAGIHLELSLVPLYAGQKLFPEMLARLRDLGFEVWALWPAFVDAKSGRLLQVDATLFRAASAAPPTLP